MSGNPRLYSLPNDDHLRTVVWAGRISAQSGEFKTARFSAWLRRIDETGQPIDDLVDHVVESVGAISLFPIGACFRHQRRVARVDNTAATVLSIRVPEKWLVKRAIDKLPGSDQCLISARDLPLKMRGRRGEEFAGFGANLVVAETTNGGRVLIPCSEVYRAFFSGSSDLANSHFRQPWSMARQDFVVDSKESLDSDGRRLWHVDLVKNVPPAIAKDLCWLEFVPGAAKIASGTYTSIVNQLQRHTEPWIRAAPPISEGTLVLHAQTMRLPRSNATLVTQIRDFKSNLRVAKITCTIAERVVPSGPASDPLKAPVEKPKPKPYAIAKPGDRRNTKGFFELSSDPVRWRGLPNPEVSPRKTRLDGGGGATQSTGLEVPVSVSVGETSQKAGVRPAAQLTPTEALRLEKRFSNVIEAIEALKKSGDVVAWDYAAIYQPVQERYCSFPQFCDTKEKWKSATPEERKAARWCRVDNRTRYALVLELEIEDRTVYWIEIEPWPRGYKGLAVETIDGESIDELTVGSLLEACAFSNGIWDESFEKTSRPLLLAAERHDPLKRRSGLSPNMFLRAFTRLTEKRTQQRNIQVESGSLTEITLTEHVSTNAAIPH